MIDTVSPSVITLFASVVTSGALFSTGWGTGVVVSFFGLVVTVIDDALEVPALFFDLTVKVYDVSGSNPPIIVQAQFEEIDFKNIPFWYIS